MDRIGALYFHNGKPTQEQLAQQRKELEALLNDLQRQREDQLDQLPEAAYGAFYASNKGEREIAVRNIQHQVARLDTAITTAKAAVHYIAEVLLAHP